ncbi:N-succinylarginine dihydrolase [Kluyvera cryocrescens]|uniref:N-succinylarginine dihydrolase n=1 Tax=Kluyvera cryocrescens TaxID=580 RepID=A0A485A9J8_KLUCR|nr:N-succinylarginine dihydrolase [Kluyvera cryocrescens]
MSAASSASAMWVANAATVCPSADALDGKVHLTVANLNSLLHRASEAPTTQAILQGFSTIPPILPSTALCRQLPRWGMKGPPITNRLGRDYGLPGTQLFIYGRDETRGAMPLRYPARQTRAASEAVARLNQTNPNQVIFAQQNPQVIDQGRVP